MLHSQGESLNFRERKIHVCIEYNAFIEHILYTGHCDGCRACPTGSLVQRQTGPPREHSRGGLPVTGAAACLQSEAVEAGRRRPWSHLVSRSLSKLVSAELRWKKTVVTVGSLMDPDYVDCLQRGLPGRRHWFAMEADRRRRGGAIHGNLSFQIVFKFQSYSLAGPLST